MKLFKRIAGWFRRRKDTYRDEISVTAQLQGEEIVQIGVTGPNLPTLRLYPSGDFLTIRMIDNQVHVERFDRNNQRLHYTSTGKRLEFFDPP